MAKNSKSVQAEAGDAAVIEGKKPAMNFVGKRLSRKQYGVMLAGVTDPLTRAAMRRMMFNRDRPTTQASYWEPLPGEAKKPLGAKK